MKLFKKKEKPVKMDKTDVLLGEEQITAIKPTKEKQPPQFLDGFDMQNYKVIDKNILEKSKIFQQDYWIPSEKPTPPPSQTIYEGKNPKNKDTVKDSLPKSGKNLTNEQKKELLKNSIIMLKCPLSSKELDLIGNSRINGKPIYRYIGPDFDSFREKYGDNYEFEEVVYHPGFGIL